MNTKKIIVLLCLIALCSSCIEEERKSGICLSFDDRTIKEWHEMIPLLRKYNASVTFFVTMFDSLVPEERSLLRELQADGHEIASHGAMHVLAENYIKKHGYSDYLEKEVNQSLVSMRRNGFYPRTFAYAYGSKYWFTDYLILRRFNVVRGVAAINSERDVSKMDAVYYKFDGNRSVDALGIDRNSKLTTDMITIAIERAMQEKEVLLLYGHCPMLTAADTLDDYKFDLRLLEFILSKSKSSGLKFYKMNDLLDL